MWYAIVRKSDGEVVSYTTVIADRMPGTLEVVTLSEKEPDQAAKVWDAATKALVARPQPPEPVTLADQLLAEPEIVALDDATRVKVRDAAERVMGS